MGVTQRTVARFDHYCVWVAQPVGERNYHHFLFFLFMTCVYMLYSAVEVGLIFYHIIEANDLWSATFVNQITKEEVKADYYVVYAFISSHYRMMFFAWATCVVMGVLVFIFFVYHVNLAIHNITTNESYKIGTFKRALKKAKKINDEQKVRDEVKKSGKNIPEKLPDLPPVPHVYQTVLDSGRGYTHYYDHGIWFNLKEIFWPRCFEPDSTYPHVKKIIPPTVKMGTRKNAAGSKNKETLATDNIQSTKSNDVARNSRKKKTVILKMELKKCVRKDVC